MTNESDTQEQRGSDWMRANPRCHRCGHRHPVGDCLTQEERMVNALAAVLKPEEATDWTREGWVTPNLIIEVEGGMVSRVLSDQPISVTIVDTDIEGCGEEDERVLRVVPASIPDDGEEYDLAGVDAYDAEVNPAEVAAYLARIEAAQAAKEEA